MNRKTFEEVLTFEEQLKFVNDRPHLTVKEIAKVIDGMPSSSLSKIFNQKGYRRSQGLYVKTKQTPQSQSPAEDCLQELLDYKDALISMALGNQQQQSTELDFSFLEQYEGQNRKTISFDLPEELANQFNSAVAKKAYKKQALMSLLVYEFLQIHK